MNVLIAEDSPTMRRVVTGIVSQAFPDTEMFEAGDGKVAWDLLKIEEIDLVLSDWLMPEMNGLELIKSIRSNERLKNLPFVMVSTKGMKQDIIEAIRAGVSDYCVKPIQPLILENKIKNALAKGQ
ncbi:response regulator [Candidatus Kapabacteria bacterium]|nr:response regulator [Candidatus Kapabacteria bacterium]